MMISNMVDIDVIELTKKMESMEDLNRQILDKLNDIDSVGDSNKEQILNILTNQTNTIIAVNKASKQSRLSIRKEIKQLQGFMIAASAGLLFFFGYSDPSQRDTFLSENGKDILALVIASAGGYKVFKSDKTSEDEEEELDSTKT